MCDLDEMECEWEEILEIEAAKYTPDRWRLHFDDYIIPYKQNRDWEQYIRNTFRWFKCRCGRRWPSNGVTVLFHFHLNKRHRGTVKVRLYRQRCKVCRNAPMFDPSIDTENLQILIESLVKNIRKKLYHEVFDEEERDHVGRDVRSPHEPDHCEGCIHGICKLKDAAINRDRMFHGYRR